MKKVKWGEAPYFYGPFHYYKESLILSKLKRYLGGSQGKILDAGCGSGSLSIKLAKLGFSVRAVDNSQKFVKFIKERRQQLSLEKQIEVFRADILNLTWPDNSLAGVCCADVLEHLEDDQQAVSEFFRVLKPGGICVVTVPSDKSLWGRIDSCVGHKRRYEKETLKKLFINVGFRIKESFFFGGFLLKFWWKYVYSNLVTRGETHPVMIKKIIFEIIPKLLFQNEGILAAAALPFKIEDLAQNKKGIGLILVAQK